jgi:hypothetical protein
VIHLAATNDPSQSLLQLETSQSFRARVAEKVIINVLSALVLGALALIWSGGVLLYQHLVNVIIVPTNLLIAIVFLGLGALLTLIILGLVLFIVIRRSNAVSLGLLLGLLGYAIASQGVPESLRNAVKAGAKTAASKAAAHGEAEPEPESTRYG